MTRTERLAEIRKAAARRFARQGFRGTSLEALAGDVGFAKSAIYKYYPGKREILDAVMVDLLESQRELGRHVILDYWGVRERLSTLMLKTREMLLERIRAAGLTAEAWAELRPLVSERLDELQVAFSAVVIEILEQGRRNREVICEDPPLVARMLCLMVADIMLALAADARRSDDEEQVRRLRTLVTVLLNGMAPR